MDQETKKIGVPADPQSAQAGPESLRSPAPTWPDPEPGRIPVGSATSPEPETVHPGSEGSAGPDATACTGGPLPAAAPELPHRPAAGSAPAGCGRPWSEERESAQPPSPAAAPLLAGGGPAPEPAEQGPAGGVAEAPRVDELPEWPLSAPPGHGVPAQPVGLVTGESGPASEYRGEYREDPGEARPDGGPNWMLAFVCFWAGGTSLNEAWVLASGANFARAVLTSPGFLGYGLLGIGLLLFALEALQWGRRRRSRGPFLLVLTSVLLTLAGLVGLILSSDPGRRI